MSQLNESSFEAISQDERIVDLLQYLYTNDEIPTDKTDASSANVQELSVVKFDQLSSRYKNAKCLNLNHCISDNADLNKSIVNKYMSLDADTYSKQEMGVLY